MKQVIADFSEFFTFSEVALYLDMIQQSIGDKFPG